MEGNLNFYTNTIQKNNRNKCWCGSGPQKNDDSDGQFLNQLPFISKVFNVVLDVRLYYIFRRSSDVFVDGAGMK